MARRKSLPKARGAGGRPSVSQYCPAQPRERVGRESQDRAPADGWRQAMPGRRKLKRTASRRKPLWFSGPRGWRAGASSAPRG